MTLRLGYYRSRLACGLRVGHEENDADMARDLVAEIRRVVRKSIRLPLRLTDERLIW